LHDEVGAPFVAAANVTVTSTRGTTSYPVAGGTATLQLWTGVDYTIAADAASSGRFSVPATVTPSTSSSASLTLGLVPWPTTPLTIHAQTAGGAAAGVAVRVKGGPRDVLLTGTTGPGGDLVVSVPTGSETYAVLTDAQGGWAATNGSVSVATTSRLVVTLVAGP
jgi:hypothetical protein